MALALDFDRLSPEQRQFIRELLFVRPHQTYASHRFTEISSIALYCTTSSDNRTVLWVPYSFGRLLQGLHGLRSLSWEKDRYLLRFTGSLRPFQEEIREEVWGHLRRNYSCILNLPPGSGKTVLGAYFCARLGLRTVIMVHREVLTVQWATTFQRFTRIPTWIVGTPINFTEYPPVLICMGTRVGAIPFEIRQKVGFMIIDEAHAFCTPEYIPALLSFTPTYVLAETATLERPDKMESVIFAICGAFRVQRKITKPFVVTHLSTGLRIPIKKDRMGNSDFTRLTKDICTHEGRNQLILRLIRANYQQFKIMVLSRRKYHAEYLDRALEKEGIPHGVMIGNRKTYNDSPILLGTTSKIGTGFDEANACPNYSGIPIDLLILVSSIKSAGLLEQNVGRAFRSLFPKIIHLVDADDISINHWKACNSWYQENGGKVEYYRIETPL